MSQELEGGEEQAAEKSGKGSVHDLFPFSYKLTRSASLVPKAIAPLSFRLQKSLINRIN
jgi:hypothetical protein